jgi:hypothetical protein
MSAVSEEEREEDESPWRFGLDEVGEEAAESESIEPETIALENVVFVLFGVALALLAFYVAVASL